MLDCHVNKLPWPDPISPFPHFQLRGGVIVSGFALLYPNYQLSPASDDLRDVLSGPAD